MTLQKVRVLEDKNKVVQDRHLESEALRTISAFETTTNGLIIGTGTTWNVYSGATLLSAIGLGTEDDVSFNSITLTTPSAASTIATTTTNFNNNLSASDTNVQLALDTLDDHSHRTYDETITGTKTFQTSPLLDNNIALTALSTTDLVNSLMVFNGDNDLVIGVGSTIDEILFQKGATFTGNLTINGDLFVNGTQTVINTTTLTTSDNLLTLNYGETGSGVTAGTAGIEVERGTGTNYLFAFQESDDTFRAGLTGQTQAIATREDSPQAYGIPYWNGTAYQFATASDLYFDTSSSYIHAAGGIRTDDAANESYLGYWGFISVPLGGGGETALMAHRDFLTSTGYMAIQNAEGTTYFNAATGRDIYLHVGGDEIFRINGSYIKASKYLDMNGTNAIQFYDSAVTIKSVDDGHLDLTADTSIDINAPDIDCSAQTTDILTKASEAAALVVKQGATAYLTIDTANTKVIANQLLEAAHGIADNQVVTIDDASAADNDYAKFTANGIEGVPYSTVLSDIAALPLAGGTMVGTIATGTYPIQFYDSAVTIKSVDDGHLDLTADVSVDINSPLIDISGQTTDIAIIASEGAALYIQDGAVGYVTFNTDLQKITFHQDLDLNENNIILDPTPGSDDGFNGTIAPFTAAQTLAFGNLCYLNASCKMALADADASSSMPVMAMATGATATDAVGNFLLMGFARDDAWAFTTGDLLYASTTAGVIAASADLPTGSGDQVQIIGLAVGTTKIYFKPEYILMEVA